MTLISMQKIIWYGRISAVIPYYFKTNRIPKYSKKHNKKTRTKNKIIIIIINKKNTTNYLIQTNDVFHFTKGI